MSLSSYYHDLADPLIERWHNFGLGLHPLGLDGPRPKIGKDGYQVCLDVHQFTPNEIIVKIIDNYISVEAHHEERQDEHGLITRQFTRRYTLPSEFNPDHVVSQLSSDGILIIKAPPPVKSSDGGKERILQILHTGPARLSVGNKEAGNAADDDQEKKNWIHHQHQHIVS